MFSFICVWINGWVNNRKAGDLQRYHAHCDVTVMPTSKRYEHFNTRSRAFETLRGWVLSGFVWYILVFFKSTSLDLGTIVSRSYHMLFIYTWHLKYIYILHNHSGSSESLISGLKKHNRFFPSWVQKVPSFSSMHSHFFMPGQLARAQTGARIKSLQMPS